MKTQIIFAALLVASTGMSLRAADNDPLPDANTVVATMLQHDAQRRTLADGYQGMRRYVLENDRMHKQAKLVARVEAESNGAKHFEIIEEDGWKAAGKHVFRKMLASEEEASSPQERPKTQVAPQNYDFRMVGTETIAGRSTYAIDVTPKRSEERLFAGRIWIDAQDYALVRVEGKPAKNPSFWIKSIHFVHTYKKRGPLWFPSSTESLTDVRIFGTTKVTINYFDYAPKPSDISETASAKKLQEPLNK